MPYFNYFNFHFNSTTDILDIHLIYYAYQYAFVSLTVGFELK